MIIKPNLTSSQIDGVPMQENLIPLKISNLVVKYKNFTAVNGLNLELQPGEIFGLLGPNGAGKTSTISCLVTLEKPDAGDIHIFGQDLKIDTLAVKQNIGFVPQEVINHGFFSVLEILNFHSGYYGLNKNQDYILYLLDRLALSEHKHKKVKQLSGGMKRRLMIAKSLVHQPKLLLLDEPTAGVDIQLRSTLWNFVLELKKNGVTVLLTTHYLEEAEALCDRIGVIHHGQLLKVGPTKTLIKDLTQRFLKIEFNKQIQVSHKNLFHAEGKTLTFKMSSNSKIGDVLRDLGEHISEVEDIHIVEGNLEDAFKIIIDQKGGL